MNQNSSPSVLIAERIRNRRLDLGLSQSQVASQAGVSMQAISLWENGKTSPGGNNIAALAKALQCDITWLIEGQSDEERINQLINNKGKISQKPQATEIKTDDSEYLEEKQNHTLKDFIAENERANVSLTEDLYHLAQIFGDLNSKRRADLLRYAIDQWKESIKEDLDKYNSIYDKLK